MKKTKPRARGKATTAWALLGRVCTHIAEEPQRYLQERYVVQGESHLHVWGLTPPCGTAACRAGWIVALHDGAIADTLYNDIEPRANAILGLPWMDTHRLFAGGALGDENPKRKSDFIPGTLPYVKAGIRGLRVFMRKHKAHLQARSLKGV